MDFSITDDQQSLQMLAREILTDVVTHDHLKKLEADSWSIFDRELWQKLADAGIAGIAVPESAGGAGLGFIEVGLVLEQVGRTVAPVPAAPTLVTSYVLAKNGAFPQALEGVADGRTILTTAFEGEVTGRVDGDGLTLTGETPFVPYGAEADVVVVPVSVDGGVSLALVRRGAATVTELQTTNREPQATLTFDDVQVPAADVVGHART
jgi:alkylation response protein AidB-like acyl-CoA dehydrogenase